MTDLITDPKQTALLVMDYQNGILGMLDGADDLVGTTTTAIAEQRRRGGPVGYVRVAFTEDDYDAIPATSPMAALATPERRAAMQAEAPTTAIDDRLAPESGDVIVRKTRIGAFSTTDLDAQLRERGVTTLLLAGISTSGVVLSTVRDAVDRDYRVIVLSDACADPKPEVHTFLTEQIFPRQTHVTTTAAIKA